MRPQAEPESEQIAVVGEEYGARLIAELWCWEGDRVRGRVVEEERSLQAYPGYLVLTRIHKLFYNSNSFSIFCLCSY